MPSEAPDQSRWSVVETIGARLRALAPGDLAQLRRDPERSAEFWRIKSTEGFSDEEIDDWAHLVKLMALLTETGRPARKVSPHQPKKPLGAALCDAGEAAWAASALTPRPMLSEQRLAQLLAARKKSRAALLERAVRMLARRKDQSRGVDCAQLAQFLFASDRDPVIKRRIASDFYRRLDRAERRADAEEKRQAEATGEAQ